MRRQDFDFELPEELIAQQPPASRTAARLLHVSGDLHLDRRVTDLPDLLRPGDLLVCNDTRVIAARLNGRKSTGGRVELLLERMLAPDRALVQLRASRAPPVGGEIDLPGGGRCRVLGRREPFFECAFDLDRPLLDYLEAYGHVPLPPYIRRPDTVVDKERYQTVFARRAGAVAAPTASLHFDQGLLSRIRQRGVEQVFVTLHVGAGTFAPMRVDDVAEHQMHAEWIEVGDAVVQAIRRTRKQGGRVVALGTTVVRALESAAANGTLSPRAGETSIFIYPGYRFHIVDLLLTNFHLPQSTLLMLVCAFAGTRRVLSAYRHAVTSGYRFFSYGDAMLLERSHDL